MIAIKIRIICIDNKANRLFVYGYLFSFVAGIGSIRKIQQHPFLTKRFTSQHIVS